jgi:hypothetical protein
VELQQSGPLNSRREAATGAWHWVVGKTECLDALRRPRLSVLLLCLAEDVTVRLKGNRDCCTYNTASSAKEKRECVHVCVCVTVLATHTNAHTSRLDAVGGPL